MSFDILTDVIRGSTTIGFISFDIVTDVLEGQQR